MSLAGLAGHWQGGLEAGEWRGQENGDAGASRRCGQESGGAVQAGAVQAGAAVWGLTRQRALLRPLRHVDDAGDELEAVARGCAVKLALVVHEALHQRQRRLVVHLWAHKWRGQQGRGGSTTPASAATAVRLPCTPCCTWPCSSPACARSRGGRAPAPTFQKGNRGAQRAQRARRADSQRAGRPLHLLVSPAVLAWLGSQPSGKAK